LDTKQRAWVFFWLLCLIWGSSFLLTRIAVADIPPTQLTVIRVGIAAVCMNIVLFTTGRRYPKDWRTLRALLIIGIGNTAVPFTLIAWGEQNVESGLASILQAVTPVFSLIIAHFVFDDERITTPKIIGIVLGFAGIVLLTSSSDSSSGAPALHSIAHEIAIVLAAFCYAVFTIYSRRVFQRAKVEPLVVSAGTMVGATIGAVVFMLGAPLVGQPGPVSPVGLPTNIIFSALMLGFLNTFVAYLLFYNVVAQLGAPRTAMITYVIPAVALTLGAVILHEQVDARLLFGAALIIGGISLTSLRSIPFIRKQPAMVEG
jgi:drug/metabolite transporter (DMT)-like permease